MKNAIAWLRNAPEMAWRHVLCRLWLDRLTLQYEAGYAAGLKEGVKNASIYTRAFDGLTPEEYEALGDDFSNDERRDADELASLEYLNTKGTFQSKIDAIKARMKQRADIARRKEERGVLAK